MLGRIIRKFGCLTGLYHLHARWDEYGITCEDCGSFTSKAEYMADMHAGCGW